VYHLELRKFPHTVCRFNQSEEQVRALVVPWANEEWVEEGERKWNSNEATLTVLEGPKLSMPELAMGRGWRNAQRRSEDVTQRVLADAKAAGVAADAGVGAAAPGGGASAGSGAAATPGGGEEPAAAAGRAAGGDRRLLADSLGLELLAALDAGPAALVAVWTAAAERLDRPPAADALSLAELAVRSLLARGLVVLQAAADGGGPAIGDERVEAALRAAASWGDGVPDALAIARTR
jgi:hypothetical protein